MILRFLSYIIDVRGFIEIRMPISVDAMKMEIIFELGILETVGNIQRGATATNVKRLPLLLSRASKEDTKPLRIWCTLTDERRRKM